MANAVDYIAWRGDLGLDVSPWNAVDALLFATLSYLDFEGTDSGQGVTLEEAARLGLLRETEHSAFQARKQMFEAMAKSRRFSGCRIHHAIAVTDGEMAMQFAAACYDLPDGTLCAAFRGTDATVVGWREDLNMSVLEPVPAQEAARFYLEKVVELDGRKIRLVGHSKGGNLAAYAAALAAPAAQDRILEVWSFDGPGMSPEVFRGEGYRRMVDRIRSYVPQTSIIGMLMEYHRNYRVARSTASGIQQHDPLTWQVLGTGFEEMDSIDETAESISETLHEWLNATEPEERADFVDAVFQMIESTKVTTVSEMKEEKLKNLKTLIESSRELSPEKRKIAGRMVGRFVSVGLSNVLEHYLKRNEEGPKPEEEPCPAEKD